MLKKIWFCFTVFFLLSANAEVGEVSVTEEVKTYQYGRFTVLPKPDGGQMIVGGEFTPPSNTPHLSKAAHAIFINYTKKELLYYRRLKDGVYEPIIGFAVVVPDRKSLPREVVRGQVYRIAEKPVWCPKVGGTVRRDDPSLPKGCLPYGHPQNSMGDWRFDINWDVQGYELVKVHGTTGYPKGEFWLEDTHGCTRLENRAIKRLVELLGRDAVTEGIEVVLWSSNPRSLLGE